MGCPLSVVNPILSISAHKEDETDPPRNRILSMNSPCNYESTNNSFITVRKAPETDFNTRQLPSVSEMHKQIYISHNFGDDSDHNVPFFNGEPLASKEYGTVSDREVQTSKTLRESETIVVKDFTSLNFSGLFTFKKHVTYSNDEFERDYMYVNKIGKGGGGEVYKVFHRKTNQYRVVKQVEKNPEMDQTKRNKLSRKLNFEAKLLSALDHPNIAKVHEVLQCEGNVMIVLEYIEGKDLYHNYKKPEFQSLEVIATIMEQLFSVLAYLDMKGVIHKDIKLQNIMLDDENTFKNLKLIDFGFSELVEKSSTRSNAGTVIYMAPEVLKRKHDKKCDVWSAGVILYLLLFKELPFRGKKFEETATEILTKDIDAMLEEKATKCPDILAIDLLKKLLERDLNMRYTATEALNDPFILKYAKVPTLQSGDYELFRIYEAKTVMELILSAIFVHNLMNYDEKENFFRVFRALDTRRRGYISSNDLNLLTTSSVEDEIKVEISGGGKSGKLSYTNLLISCVDMTKKDVLRRLFVYLSRDDSMVIYMEDIYAMLEKYIDKSVLKRIMNHFQKKEIEKISYFNFTEMTKSF